MIDREEMRDIKIRNAYRKLANAIVSKAIKDKRNYERAVEQGITPSYTGTPVSEYNYRTACIFLESDWCELLKSLALGDV